MRPRSGKSPGLDHTLALHTLLFATISSTQHRVTSSFLAAGTSSRNRFVRRPSLLRRPYRTQFARFRTVLWSVLPDRADRSCATPTNCLPGTKGGTMQALAASLMDDVTDPSDWKQDFAILRNLDASLRCDLCFVCTARSFRSSHPPYA